MTTDKSVKVQDHPWPFFSCHIARGWGFWLRIYGYGVTINTGTLLFSERYGLGPPFIKIGKVKIKLLAPRRY